MTTNTANPITSARVSLRLYDLVLLATILWLLISASSNAMAGSATWSRLPGSSDWNTATNWSPQTVPNSTSDTATFVLSSITNIYISADTEVASIVFHLDRNFQGSAFNIIAQGQAFFPA